MQINSNPIIQTISINNINKSNTHIDKNASSSIKFGAAIPKDVSKLLDEQIYKAMDSNPLNIVQNVKFHSLINKTLPLIMTPENFLNKGRESKVYRISDNFVAKIKRGTTSKNAVHPYNVMTVPDKRFNRLPFYYGEPVLRVGNVEILKNATPSKDFRFCGTPYRGASIPSREDIELYNKEYLPLCSSLPQKSYDDFAFGLKELNGIRKLSGCKLVSYVPDIMNPNNILISEGQFKIVDKLDKVPLKNPNSIYTMLEPLMLRLSPEATANRDCNLLGYRRNIFKKTLIAAEKAELPLESSIKYPYSDYVLNDIVDSNAVSLVEKMKELREDGISKDDRVNLINKVFEY